MCFDLETFQNDASEDLRKSFGPMQKKGSQQGAQLLTQLERSRQEYDSMK